MHPGDPRFQTFPPETGVSQLRWYINQTATGALTVQEFLADFRTIHEAIEKLGHPEYASREQARAIWDVLSAVEFGSADIGKEESPNDWYSPEGVLAVVKRAAEKLG